MIVPKLTHPEAELFVPDAVSLDRALTRTTHLGVGAHQDDLEFMALHGILECFQKDDSGFGGITCMDGAGSSRAGPYADYDDRQMKIVRAREQKAAAMIGQYSFMAQLAQPSVVAREKERREVLVDDLASLLLQARPEIVYTHNPFDKHATHIGVLVSLLEAIHRLPGDARPRCLLGCEVWRGLDWLPDDLKVVHVLDAHPNLAVALNGVFDSQIAGGKRYDLAVEGRRLANATFFDSHSVDNAQRVAYAVDLSELIGTSPAESLRTFGRKITDAFAERILEALP